MQYELMLVVTTKANPEAFISGVEKSLKEASAVDLKVERLGKKILAYPIRRQTEGEYFIFNFEAGGEAIKNINDKLRLEQEALLRYLIIKSHGAKGAILGGKGPQAVKAKVIVKTVGEKSRLKSVKKDKKSKPQRAKAVKRKSKK